MTSKSIAVLYSSETGTAEDFATILSHKLRRYHLHHTFSTLGDYNPKDILNCRYLFILCSTTGQGALPRNARENTNGEVNNTFWSFLKKKQLPADFLNHVKVGLFGLGDSSYTRFNYAIRKIDKRIVDQLGAIELFPRFEADETGLAGSNSGSGSGVESVYFEFERLVLNHLLENYPNRNINGKMVKREAVADEFYLKPHHWLELNDSGYAEEEIKFLGDKSIRYGRVVANKRITSHDHFQDVRQFVFSAQDEETYYPGDTVRIYPSNTDSNVQAFLENQPHWKKIADKQLKLAGDKDAKLIHDGGVVSHLTIRNILKYHCDIMGIPSKSFFMKIWTFATNTNIDGGAEQCQAQRDKLKEFGMDTDMQDLFDYCSRPRRSILEVLADFSSVVLPWEYMLDYLPLVKPRYFSISGNPCAKDIELTIAIVKYKTILKRIRKGLCTDYVSRLQKNDTIRYKIQHNSLFSKVICESPVIMVSPGVGLAPMMCLIRSGMFNKMHLFFGNRFKDKDFLYAEELLKWNAENRIKLFTCFSRDCKASPAVRYVQDVIWENGKEVADLIVKENAVFYLCGSSGKMPIQVRLTISELLKKWGGFQDDETAERYLKDMEKSDRYIQETW